ncbi:MAG: DUF86 domain-containing protein [Spartobacteria bacterium]|nr:DUF86 domain-containing protein [Spartobacteria bacterium]
MDSGIILADLDRALKQLESALRVPADNDVFKAGCIQYFEFCFELAWKTMKSIASDQGVGECNSPKSSLKFAFKSGWIDNEVVWLDMLKARNKMSHTYNASSAMEIYDRLSDYRDALRALTCYLQNMEL